ncbi:MAG: ABC transporter ATP-binding protein/permease [Frankiaceae bacterium]|jgi:subfamily B ATP-binding cassette protein MsbA|nr:ABC transporter ATP-binding protein/permease [Frankiaceae bacterium]
MFRTCWWFRHALAPHAWALGTGAFLVALVAALQVAEPWPLKVIVDDVIKDPSHRDGVLGFFGLSAATAHTILTAAVVAMLTITLANALADFGGSLLLNGVGERVTAAIRAEVFTHLQRMSLSYHDRQRLGDLVTRTTADVNYVESLLTSLLSVLVPNVLILVFIGTICLAVDPIFAGIAFAVAPLLFLVVLSYRRRIKAASKAARNRDSDLASTVTETFSSVRVMQAYTSEEQHRRRFQDRNIARLAAGLRTVRLQATLSPLVDVIVALGTLLVLWIGVRRVQSGAMSLGLLLVFISYLKTLYSPMKALAKLTTVISRGQASAERLREVLQTAPAIADRPGARVAPPLAGSVELRGVSFAYTPQRETLHDINLRVEPGQMVAITGPTGSGKSSIVSLIPRLYDPARGAVLIDGIDVRDMQLASLRAQVSLVLQESILFRGSIYDNIAYGAESATPEQVHAAARAAYVEEFVRDLPDGYDTQVAERGVTLSGGQRQRIAIARALVRNTPIVILDEPTSGLDSMSEQYVMQGLEQLMAGRTVVVIAHRLSTLRNADRIYVVDQGRIVESGRHDELLAAHGLYSRLDALQRDGANAAGPPAEWAPEPAALPAPAAALIPGHPAAPNWRAAPIAAAPVATLADPLRVAAPASDRPPQLPEDPWSMPRHWQEPTPAAPQPDQPAARGHAMPSFFAQYAQQRLGAEAAPRGRA